MSGKVLGELSPDRGVPQASDCASLPDASVGPWYVLHTRSRQEKALSTDLAALRIAHYLPMVSQIRFYGKRKAVVEVPLFPGYVFLRGSLDQAYRADRTKRVAQVIRVADQQQMDWELQNLHLALSCSADLNPYPYLTKGIRVEVRSGPFHGLQGIVEERTSNGRLILQINMLGRAVSLEIDGAMLVPL